MSTKWIMLLPALGWLGLAANVAAAEDAGGSPAEAATNMTSITSKHLDFEYPKRTAVFQGDVVVIDPRVRITADTLTAVFDTNNAPESITAEGNVHITQTNRVATCHRAVYTTRSGLLVLLGKPKVAMGIQVMEGSRIIFSRDDDKVSGDDVTVTFWPGQGTPGLGELDALGGSGKNKKK